MKNFDFKNNNLTKVIALLLVTTVAIGLVSSTAIKLAASTYYLQNKRQLKTDIPFVDEIIDAVVDNRIPFVPVDPQPSVTEPTTQAPTTQAPTTEAPTTQAPTTEAPSGEDKTDAPTEPAGDAGAGDLLGTLTGLLGGIDIGGITDTIGGLVGGITGGEGEGEGETETTTEPTTESAESIKQKQTVLSEYKDVVNYAKKVGKPSFQKVTYRTLNKGFMDSFLLHSIESAYPEYFISKENAAAAPIVVPANKATGELLINNDYYACMLANDDAAEAIESATSVKLEDGTRKIVITLKGEANPAVTAPDAKKAGSFTSSMFPVITAQDFADMVAPTLKLTSISASNVAYAGCTVELIYNPLLKRIVSITQTTNYIGEVKGTVLTCRGTVTEVSEYSNFDYGIL